MPCHEPPISRRAPRGARCLVALLAGVLSLGLGHAHAQEKRIVVMPFSGSGAKNLQSAATEALQGNHQIIPDRDYTRAARKHKARGLEPRDVALVAGELGADGVLLGAMDRNGNQRQGVLRLLSGKSGEQAAEIRIDIQRRRLGPEEQEELRARLLEAVAALPSLEVVEVVDEEPIELDPDPVSEQTSDDELPDLSGEVSGEEPDRNGPRGPGAPRAGIDLALGLGFTSRVLRSATEGNVRGPEYTGPPAPGLLIELELYPLALGRGVPAPGLLRNLGIRAHLERVFALASELPYVDPQDPDAGEMTVELGTDQMRLGVGLVYRLTLGSKPTAPTLVAGVGYDRMQFSVDRSNVPAGVTVDLPDVRYTSIDPGLALRYPLSEALAITARGRLLLVTGTGPMQRADAFGDASAMGFDLGAGVEYRLGARLSVRAGLRLARIATSFDGTGPDSNLRDGDPDTIDVTGVTDRYLGGAVTAGYAF